MLLPLGDIKFLDSYDETIAIRSPLTHEWQVLVEDQDIDDFVIYYQDMTVILNQARSTPSMLDMTCLDKEEANMFGGRVA